MQQGIKLSKMMRSGAQNGESHQSEKIRLSTFVNPGFLARKKEGGALRIHRFATLPLA